MNFRPVARAVGAALALAPAVLAAQSSKVVSLGGQDYTMTYQSLVSAAGNINTDPRYQTPVSPAYNGVGSIAISTTAGLFICTGSLLADGQTVLTAGHCVSNLPGTVTGISVNFFPDANGVPETIAATSWNANPNYSGDVIDENDVGVIHLGSKASAGVTRYQLYTGSAVDNNFQFVGYGQRGSNGLGVGAPGNGAGFGLGNRRTGYNLFDIALGDDRWQGFWNAQTVGDPTHVLFADFDNGTTGFNSNDGMCFLGRFSNFTLGHSECDAGRGLDEADTGGGDSGGPGFINGQIASVTSFGLTFGQQGTGFGDIDENLNSSFGEYAGFTDVAFQAQWINSQLVVATPEPTTTVLMATGLLGVAGIVRRRRKAA